MRSVDRTAVLAAVLTAVISGAAAAQGRDFSKVEIKTTPLTDSLYMLVGAGGNIGVSVGADGVYLIDDQFAPLSEKILAAVRALDDGPIRFVVNTHWHGDHTGGNENMGKAGAMIVAHDNVRARMSGPQSIPAFGREVPASPDTALPDVTFNDQATLHLNGETARLIHVANAHTDGDSFIHFESSNVLHTGDLFFNGFYPFIDVWNGGSLEGLVKAVDVLIGHTDAETKIVPGHGPLATRADLERYREMLATVLMRATEAAAAGQSAADLAASGALDDIEADWGGGFLNTAKFLGIVMTGMSGG